MPGNFDNRFTGTPPTDEEKEGVIINARDRFAKKREEEPKEKVLEDFIRGVYGTSQRPKAILAHEFAPQEQLWRELEIEKIPEDFGRGAINPESKDMHFGSMSEILVPNLENFTNKRITEVAEYLVKTYGDEYYIPDITYMDWLHKNPKGRQGWLKAEKRYFFFGSAIRNHNGYWGIPTATDDSDTGWNQQITLLKGAWLSNFRVVLIKK